ncbi:3524_t:CDS:2 [Ambispora gerdemannii]|uniref:Beta-hexosaminidase n=1 Tax=Ambispora gerdemannii TaxID=144530 RepID=A0A9N9FWL1_9GLOM|nr:3524_t:CDS:2 [Ambispora gerdemannii]
MELKRTRNGIIPTIRTASFLVVVFFTFTIISVINAVTVNPLPKPREIKWGEKGPINFPLDIQVTSSQSSDIVKFGWERTLKLIKQDKWVVQALEAEPPAYDPFPPQIQTPGGKRSYTFLYTRTENSTTNTTASTKSNLSLKSVKVDVTNLNAELQHGVDESYTLEVKEDGLIITSPTVWGALHAFNTLTQIVISDEKGGLIIESTVSIKDSPLYPHRGLLLDTGRNFYPVKDILRTIEALAWSKLNVLHWHIVDSHSWPFEVKAYPSMTKDAYSKREIYTPKDVQLVIKFAHKRGVRVIPEFDMPGHARAGYLQIDPSIVSCANSWWSNDDWPHHSAVEPPPGQLDIINPKTYEVIKNLFAEISAAFPEKIYHAGFDELQRYCYAYSNLTVNWFKENPSNTYNDLAQYFLDRAYPIFTNENYGGKRVMMWEDVYLSEDFAAKKVPKEVILQTWNNGVNNTKKLTSNGYDVVVTSADWFYLDCGNGGWVGNDNRYDQNIDNGKITFNFAGGNSGSWCNGYKTWQRIYDYDIDFKLTADEKKHVLGGEVALWSEQSDPTVLDPKVWPRAAALAELLWSGNKNEKGEKRYREMQQRINDYRERLVSRGVGAAPLQPKFCYKNPHACDLNLNKVVPGYD